MPSIVAIGQAISVSLTVMKEVYDTVKGLTSKTVAIEPGANPDGVVRVEAKMTGNLTYEGKAYNANNAVVGKSKNAASADGAIEWAIKSASEKETLDVAKETKKGKEAMKTKEAKKELAKPAKKNNDAKKKKK